MGYRFFLSFLAATAIGYVFYSAVETYTLTSFVDRLTALEARADRCETEVLTQYVRMSKVIQYIERMEKR